ncbi:hypothetical protein OFN56_35485, partial [Escherichia coli]|nr:hypothetical protein [Escherichia coli]
MESPAAKRDVILQLQQDILAMQGAPLAEDAPRLKTGLGEIEQSFPNQTFPTGAVHEFVSPAAAD